MTGVVALLIGSLVLSGCGGPRAAVKSAFDPSKVRRVAIKPFEGIGGTPVANEFVRQWVGTGLDITNAQQPSDLVLLGSVTEYKPSDQHVVFLGNTPLLTSGGQTVTVSNPVLSLHASAATPEGSALGMAPKVQMVSVSAVVGVSARLVEPVGGQVLWADSYAYEGLDVQWAQQAVVEWLTRSMGRVLPPVMKKRS